MRQLLSPDLINALRPDQARRLFDLLSTFNDERDDMDATIARATDEVDRAIHKMI